MKIRRVISLTVFLSFFFLALSGLMLFLSPQGRVAYWAGWSLFGLSKEEYSAVHTTFMILFLVTGIWHIVLNWKPIMGYMKDRSRKIRVLTPESSVAMALGAAFLLGPLFRVPPFAQFLDAGEDIKGYWEAMQGSPPWGHAEETRLDAFCRRIVDFQRWEGDGPIIVDCDEAEAALVAAGMEVEGQTQRILEIAQANRTTPQVIAEIVVSVARPATPEEVAGVLVDGAGGFGMGAGDAAGHGTAATTGPYFHPPSGLGRKTLEGYAEEYDYDLNLLLSLLAEKGMNVNPKATLREEADRLGITPSDIIDALNGGG